jgi:hypothetical protein
MGVVWLTVVGCQLLVGVAIDFFWQAEGSYLIGNQLIVDC